MLCGLSVKHISAKYLSITNINLARFKYYNSIELREFNTENMGD